jgi:hypothetical protein
MRQHLVEASAFHHRLKGAAGGLDFGQLGHPSRPPDPVRSAAHNGASTGDLVLGTTAIVFYAARLARRRP